MISIFKLVIFHFLNFFALKFSFRASVNRTDSFLTLYFRPLFNWQTIPAINYGVLLIDLGLPFSDSFVSCLRLLGHSVNEWSSQWVSLALSIPRWSVTELNAALTTSPDASDHRWLTNPLVFLFVLRIQWRLLSEYRSMSPCFPSESGSTWRELHLFNA